MSATWREEAAARNVAIDAALAKYGIAVASVFVPFSQSRNKAEKMPSLNWRVTLRRNGRDVLTTDYSAGCAHAPSYKQGIRSVNEWDIVQKECETGKPHKVMSFATSPIPGAAPILPDARDVVHSLLSDADVLDAGGFDQWCDETGFNPDSIKHKAIYDACIELALKMRSGVGDEALRELRDVFSGY